MTYSAVFETIMPHVARVRNIRDTETWRFVLRNTFRQADNPARAFLSGTLNFVSHCASSNPLRELLGGLGV